MNPLTRRRTFGVFAGALATAVSGCGGPAAPVARGDHDGAVRITYGGHPSQFAELSLPDTPVPAPVVVVIHGGYWRASYGLELGRPLAQDLNDRGFAALNVEYRRVGDGGGWPQSGDDVAAAVGMLMSYAAEVDLSSVVALGHSAGGQLGAWLAAQRAAAVPLTGAVLQAGVLDLVEAERDGLGGGAVADYLGGTPQRIPEVYAAASATSLVPLGVPTICVHGTRDALVPVDQSQRFVDAAQKAGDTAELRTFDGDHFEPITVGTPAWELCVAALEQLRN